MNDTPSDADDPSDAETKAEAEPAPEPPESALDSERYAHLSLDDGGVVIYDRQEPDTWVQSDFVVDVGV